MDLGWGDQMTEKKMLTSQRFARNSDRLLMFNEEIC